MKKSLYILLVTAFLLSACAVPATEAQPEPLPVDPAGSTMPALSDPSQPITVSAGEVFMIVVESNPSTGYHWEIIGELNGLELVSREYTAAEPVMVGSGGVEVWTLKAIAAGETSLVLGNFPPGEETTQVQEKSFSINIQ